MVHNEPGRGGDREGVRWLCCDRRGIRIYWRRGKHRERGRSEGVRHHGCVGRVGDGHRRSRRLAGGRCGRYSGLHKLVHHREHRWKRACVKNWSLSCAGIKSGDV